MGVTGVGGVFFRAKDPKALSRWYAEMLGVGASEWGIWQPESGPSVFLPFAADTGSQRVATPLRVLHVTSGLGTGGAELMLERLVSSADQRSITSAVLSLGSRSDIGDRIAAAVEELQFGHGVGAVEYQRDREA